MSEIRRFLPELEPEAEELIKLFPKNPLVCADVHSIAISLKRIADALRVSSNNQTGREG